jgi:hypothetical protein
MHEKFSIDDSTFDRLVDGELTPGERRELLASLDHVPDGWRRCALSFLEAQSWREGFGEFVRHGADEHDAILAESSSAVVSVLPANKRDRSMRQGLAWAAIAAGLLLAFTLGKTTREGGAPIAVNDATSSRPQVADVVPPPSSALADGAPTPDALTLFVRDDSGKTHPLRVPLVDAGTLEELGMQFQSGVPDDLRAQLQTRGFDVQSKKRYAPLWLENGQPMFVPVEDTKIVPVGSNVY